MMGIRRSRKYKEKRTMFAFGHLMLPLVGILAIGLLVLGVKLLFMTPKEEISYPDAPAVEQDAGVTAPDPEPPGANNVDDPSGGDQPAGSEVLAVPVPEEEPVNDPIAGARPSAPVVVKIEQQPTSDPDVKPEAKPETAKASNSMCVQIGAFTDREAAQEVAKQARAKGYEAFLVRAEVGGKVYYRVRIPAGNSRKEAEKTASRLAADGYPTFITSID